MSQQINVNIRMDKDIKKNADKLFNELGFSMTTAINAFVRQALRDRAIPFIIKADDSSQDTIRRKDLIARGRESGRVLHVSEAFTKYPVENEDHKGKLDYWMTEGDTDGL